MSNDGIDESSETIAYTLHPHYFPGVDIVRDETRKPETCHKIS